MPFRCFKNNSLYTLLVSSCLFSGLSFFVFTAGMDSLPQELIISIFAHAFVPSRKHSFYTSGAHHRYCVQDEGCMNSGLSGDVMLSASRHNYAISYGTVQSFRGAFASCRAFWLAYVWYIKQRQKYVWLNLLDAQKPIDKGFLQQLSQSSVAPMVEALQITVTRNMTVQNVFDAIQKFPVLRVFSVISHPIYDETLECLNVEEPTAKSFRKKLKIIVQKNLKIASFDSLISCLFFYA